MVSFSFFLRFVFLKWGLNFIQFDLSFMVCLKSIDMGVCERERERERTIFICWFWDETWFFEKVLASCFNVKLIFHDQSNF